MPMLLCLGIRLPSRLRRLLLQSFCQLRGCRLEQDERIPNQRHRQKFFGTTGCTVLRKTFLAASASRLQPSETRLVLNFPLVRSNPVPATPLIARLPLLQRPCLHVNQPNLLDQVLVSLYQRSAVRIQ